MLCVKQVRSCLRAGIAVVLGLCHIVTHDVSNLGWMTIWCASLAFLLSMLLGQSLNTFPWHTHENVKRGPAGNHNINSAQNRSEQGHTVTLQTRKSPSLLTQPTFSEQVQPVGQSLPVSISYDLEKFLVIPISKMLPKVMVPPNISSEYISGILSHKFFFLEYYNTPRVIGFVNSYSHYL